MSAKAIIYRRHSLDRLNNELGIDRQLKVCQQVAKTRGLVVDQVITDNDVSASKRGRPGYTQLIDLMKSGTVSTVLILRIDRLLRLNDELEELIQLVEQYPVKVITAEGDIDLSTPAGRLMARILVSVARNEMEMKSLRHKLANEQKASKGLPHGSRRPFGYEADLVTIRESEASLLREMARRVLAGHSFKEIAWWLNEAGHRTTQGKLWYPITVRNMLLKKRYAGIREYNGVDYPGIWPAVVDKDTWNRLQLVMRLKQRPRGSTEARKYLLTGLLVCGKCGLPLNGATKRDHPGRPIRRTYHCRVQGDSKRGRGCGGVVRGADALEDFVKECVLARLDSPRLHDLMTRGSDLELRQALHAREAQQLRIDLLVDDYATGLLTKVQLTRAKATAEAELARLDREILGTQGCLAVTVPAGQTLREAWETSPSDEWRRGIVGLLVKQIVVLPGITKPRYKGWRFDPSLVQVEWVA